MRRAVGQRDRCSRIEIHAGRDRHRRLRRHDDLLRECALTGEGDDLVADFVMRHAFTDGADHAGEFTAGREWQRRLVLIFILHDQDIGEIHAGSFNVDGDLARARRGVR